jgi:hypothetical protein
MAIKLITNYCKRLGLPGYSSHQFSVSVETELTTTDDIPAESARLYQLLQGNVDQQMQTTGFVPPGTYGMEMPNGTNGSPPGVNGIRVSSPPADAHRKRRVTALLETAVIGIADNRHHPQPSMHCSWCQYKNECMAWLPGRMMEERRAA